ncbi:hypothetical protein PR202_gb04467 [Eleusine coracana subsp. coracana]|uniref:Uncharacterized protein n=1 Tax=Eleusine coracana subsp. coracana TaxID=191504 RepID=A0AAV5E455_ELECO|nr:hypothetical protein PR202_gb04467 [Eleusine coracana subsp. coracana]
MAAEAILGAFMQTLFQKLSEIALDQFRSYRGIHGKLDNLSGILSELKNFLDDAEAKQLTDASVRGWLAKLKDIAYDIDDLLDRYSAKKYASEASYTGKGQFSNLLLPDRDKEEMVRLLLSDSRHSSCNVCVIPVVGMGGLGKTTLMQMVYHDDRVKEHFQLRIWVYVSESFDERKLTQETLEAAAYDQSIASTNMNMLQEILLQSTPWQEDDDSWSVFKSHAFRDGDCSSTYPQLELIGREIVKKLKGLPLASKALGSLLFCKTDEEDWKDILRNDIWELPAEKNNILPALRLSYNHLPPHLKQCFVFCSVYPKDYIFRREKLVKIWLALGFIRQSSRRRLEDTGNSYFSELLSRSFFQPYKDNYVMHDAMHDLAKFISMEDCHQFEHNRMHDNAYKIRHLSFRCTDTKCMQFGPLYGYTKLRTLVIMHGYKSKMSQLPDGVFVKLQYLRVLDMHGSGLKELPESIGNLKQIRFLDLTSTEIKTLPISIVKLYNLQILKMIDCNSLRDVPQGITKLTNMRYFEASTRLLTRIPGIGNLICLQELEEFVVQKRPRTQDHRVA